MNEKFWLLGIQRNIIADVAVTGGQYDLIEGLMPHGVQTPPHIHHQYLETEFVVEGELTIYLDSETVVLGPGEDILFLWADRTVWLQLVPEQLKQ